MYSWPGLVKAVLVAAAVVLAARCWPTSDGGAQPPPPEADEIAAALADAMVVLETDQVTRLLSTSSCQRIEYRRGAFASAWAERCSHGMSPFRPLDGNATADIERITGAFDVGRADFWGIDRVEFSPDGKLLRAEFKFAFFLGGEVFVYEPGYRLPPDQSGQRWHAAIDQDWYQYRVDWP